MNRCPREFFDYRYVCETRNCGRVQLMVRTIRKGATKRNHVNRALAALVLVLMSGCVAVKNQAPLVPSPRIAAAWEPRYPSSIQVRLPALESLPATSPSVYQWQIDVVRQDARRLAGILSKCRLFSDVVLSNSAPGTNVIVVEALPRPPSLADPDSAWLLLSGGVIPYYDRVDVGVRFRFVNGEGNDFVFPWTTRYVIGFWAPAVVGIGPGWRFGVLGLLNPANPDSTYWIDLRSALIDVMDRIEAAPR